MRVTTLSVFLFEEFVAVLHGASILLIFGGVYALVRAWRSGWRARSKLGRAAKAVRIPISLACAVVKDYR